MDLIIANANWDTLETLTTSPVKVCMYCINTLNTIFVAGCNETYTDKQIVIIFSPGFPSVYTPFHNCIWKITASKPHFYQIEISSFSLNYSPMCKLDYLKISDHANKLALPNNGKLCGLHRKISIVSRTSELTIRFRSFNQSQGGTGFRLVYWQLSEKKRRYVEIDGIKM